MRVWKFPDQIVRLFILFSILLGGLLLLRQHFVPESFGEKGHYRAVAPDLIAAQEILYAGWQTCLECHDDIGEIKNGSYHRTVSCEVCHGPAADHAADPGEAQPVILRGREGCLYCHSYLPSRATGFPQVIEMQHNPMESCTECHNPHDPTPPSVPGSCGACHGQIARTKAISHHNSVACEVCHETQPEHMQSPRLYLPKKPAERGFCGRCHAEDADSPRRIPRIDMASHGGSYPCWQCHYPHFPEGR